MATGIKGMDQVQTNLNKALAGLKINSVKALLKAAIFVRNDMDKTDPKIPVDTNTLRASWFTYPGMVVGNPVLLIGFSANYAAFVHEMVDKGNINWNREGSGPKFFAAHLDRNHNEILKIIANDIKLD